MRTLVARLVLVQVLLAAIPLPTLLLPRAPLAAALLPLGLAVVVVASAQTMPSDHQHNQSHCSAKVEQAQQEALEEVEGLDLAQH